MAFGWQSERRRGDRRRGDRRRPPRSASGDSDFSAFAETSTFTTREDPATVAGLLAAAEEANEPDAAVGATRGLLRSIDGPALPRVLRTYVLARALLGLALAAAPFVTALAGGHPSWPVVLVALAYSVQAVATWRLRKAVRDPERELGPLHTEQWLWTIGVDLLCFLALRFLDPSGLLNYGALLLLPLLLAGVLTQRRAALATASGVVLVLLAGAGLSADSWSEAMVPLSQAGLAGAGMFAITLLGSELAQRLAGEERTARRHYALARQQVQLNRLVIEEMTEGVLVINRRGQVLAMNPAAQALLGARHSASDVTQVYAPGLVPLRQALAQAYTLGVWPDDARELDVALPEGGRRRLQVRARFTRRPGMGGDGAAMEDVCVLFLEDLRAVQARLRQDKLAAMGRMSAGIAHEIRNPLAAIAQANALLSEDALAGPQRHLARIVSDNVERLKRIVDDVLNVAAAPSPQAVVMELASAVRQVCDEWLQGAGAEVEADRRFEFRHADPPLPVRFDPEHLRRVLVNLLDNAARHASRGDGAVQVTVAVESGETVAISVASDGEPIPADTERHLFEPFFSTRARGSGLGLYICRELCAHHGATIEYLPAPVTERRRNVFRVAIHRIAT